MVVEQRVARSYSDLPQEVKDKISRSSLEVEGLPMREETSPCDPWCADSGHRGHAEQDKQEPREDHRNRQGNS